MDIFIPFNNRLEVLKLHSLKALEERDTITQDPLFLSVFLVVKKSTVGLTAIQGPRDADMLLKA